jgi:iron(III) transport system ATP-binding protein
MLSVRGLCTDYATVGARPVNAVRDLTFDVPRGRFFTLLGPSGCGKTTTLRSIAGLERPIAGEISVESTVVFSAAGNVFVPANRRRFGMVFQSYAIWPHMNVYRNVAFPLVAGPRRLPKAEVRDRVLRVLKTVALEDLAEREATRLSGGQQQRLALARALVMEPALLLLDEPLSNLDANLREEMRFEVRRLHDEYRYTTVYVTHDQSEAMTTADIIAVMNGGKIEQSGSPEEIYERPRSEFVARFIGSSNVVSGKNLDDSRISFAGTPLRCAGAKLAAGGTTAVSIRQHAITIRAAKPQQTENVVPATVVRQVFLGDSRDYMVEVADGTQLRIVTSAEESIPQGSAVWLELPPENCRALMG